MESICLDARGNLLAFCLFVGKNFDVILGRDGDADCDSLAVANVREVVSCARQEEGRHNSVREREDVLLALLRRQMGVTDRAQEGGKDAASQFLRRTDGRTQSKMTESSLFSLLQDFCNRTEESSNPYSDLVTLSREAEATMRVWACAKQLEKDGHISTKQKEATLALLHEDEVASPSEQCAAKKESETGQAPEGATASTCATEDSECPTGMNTQSKGIARSTHKNSALTSDEHSTATNKHSQEGKGAVRQFLEETDGSTCATKLDFSECITDGESDVFRTCNERDAFTGKQNPVPSDNMFSQTDTFQVEESALVTPQSAIRQMNSQHRDLSDSDADGRVNARKQMRKKKHQAKKNAAAKKRERFSATEDVATKDALGVEEMGSALQIARHPPKPSRSKQNQGQKTKRQRQAKSQRLRRNEAKAMTKVGGSRRVLNKDVKSRAGQNDCFAKQTCLPDAVSALLPPQLKQWGPNLFAAMPKGRDAAPQDLKNELDRLGLSLERAPEYFKKGHTAAHLLLQERTCKLVVHVHLTDADENKISHFVAWDGSTVIDHPCNVKVNSSSDRSSPVKSQEAFDKLFKAYCKTWQITSVHRLKQRNTQKFCKC